MGAIFTLLTLRGAMLLISIISAAVMIPEVLFHNQPVLDPFAPYADILPGQARDSMSPREFNCQFELMTSLEESCLLTPETGMFDEIEVRIAQDTGRVNRATFRPRESTLTVGDLILLWDKPQVAIYGQNANLRWHHIRAVAIPVTFNGYVSHWLPITYVAFESAN